MTQILIVDDNRTTTTTLCSLAGHWGLTADGAFDGEQALTALQQSPYDVVVTDLRMPNVDGMQLLTTIREEWPDTVVIVVTAHGSIEIAVEAMQKGAFDFLTKPYDDGELRAKIERAVEQRQMMVRMERLDARVASLEEEKAHQFGEMVGSSAAMNRVYDEIRKVAETESTVMLLGESGTGKELAARAIHDSSTRRDQAFVAVHCAAYAEGLLESELFGHEKGAFTGAVARKLGRLDLADGGTLFLDEIGDVPLPVQVKLLRVLQEREFERVGGTQTLKFDSRIIAATNRDLVAAIADGTFREDLYYRLNVFTVEMPSLRNRKEDLRSLVESFCERATQRTGQEVPGVTERALQAISEYEWPGNVRELLNAIERASILAAGAPIDLAHLPMLTSPGKGNEIALPESDVDFDDEMENFERRLILHAYEQCDHVKARTAKMLGIDRNRLRYKLRKYGIDD